MKIDLTELESLCKGDRSRMEKYIKFYLDSSSNQFEALSKLARQGDYETLADAAHGMRPQVLYMGASELYDLLKRIELSAKSNDLNSVLEFTDEAVLINEALKTELKLAING